MVSGEKEGTFKTFRRNQDSFSFTASSCAIQMSQSDAFNAMDSLNPDFFINVGDIHYGGTNRTVQEEFVFAYHEIFKSEP